MNSRGLLKRLEMSFYSSPRAFHGALKPIETKYSPSERAGQKSQFDVQNLHTAIFLYRGDITIPIYTRLYTTRGGRGDLPCRIKLEPSNLRLFCPHYRVNKIGAPLLRPCSLLPSIIYSEGVLFISMLLLFGASFWYLNAHQQIFPFQILVRVLERQRVMRTWNKSIHLNQPRRLNSCDGAILLMIQITLLLPLFKCDCH